MRAMYFIIAVAMLFMFTFVAGRTELGTARTLLSAGFIGLFLYSGAQFIIGFRKPSRKRKTDNQRQQEYKEYLEEQILNPALRSKIRREMSGILRPRRKGE